MKTKLISLKWILKKITVGGRVNRGEGGVGETSLIHETVNLINNCEYIYRFCARSFVQRVSGTGRFVPNIFTRLGRKFTFMENSRVLCETSRIAWNF